MLNSLLLEKDSSSNSNSNSNTTYSGINRMIFPPDVDIEFWLTTKLEEPWSSEKLCSLLTLENLTSIGLKFSNLETSIKLRTLFSFLGLRKKVLEELKSPIQTILHLALQDDDEWVRVISSILPILLSEETEVINKEIPNEIFNKTKQEILEFS